jgi:hypothetical protein
MRCIRLRYQIDVNVNVDENIEEIILKRLF